MSSRARTESQSSWASVSVFLTAAHSSLSSRARQSSFWHHLEFTHTTFFHHKRNCFFPTHNKKSDTLRFIMISKCQIKDEKERKRQDNDETSAVCWIWLWPLFQWSRVLPPQMRYQKLTLGPVPMTSEAGLNSLWEKRHGVGISPLFRIESTEYFADTQNDSGLCYKMKYLRPLNFGYFWKLFFLREKKKESAKPSIDVSNLHLRWTVGV